VLRVPFIVLSGSLAMRHLQAVQDGCIGAVENFFAPYLAAWVDDVS